MVLFDAECFRWVKQIFGSWQCEVPYTVLLQFLCLWNGLASLFKQHGQGFTFCFKSSWTAVDPSNQSVLRWSISGKNGSQASDCVVKQPENLKSFVQQWARSSDRLFFWTFGTVKFQSSRMVSSSVFDVGCLCCTWFLKLLIGYSLLVKQIEVEDKHNDQKARRNYGVKSEHFNFHTRLSGWKSPTCFCGMMYFVSWSYSGPSRVASTNFNQSRFPKQIIYWLHSPRKYSQ